MLKLISAIDSQGIIPVPKYSYHTTTISVPSTSFSLSVPRWLWWCRSAHPSPTATFQKLYQPQPTPQKWYHTIWDVAQHTSYWCQFSPYFSIFHHTICMFPLHIYIWINIVVFVRVAIESDDKYEVQSSKSSNWRNKRMYTSSWIVEPTFYLLLDTGLIIDTVCTRHQWPVWLVWLIKN